MRLLAVCVFCSSNTYFWYISSMKVAASMYTDVSECMISFGCFSAVSANGLGESNNGLLIGRNGLVDILEFLPRAISLQKAV